jgi:hypothetical protein
MANAAANSARWSIGRSEGVDPPPNRPARISNIDHPKFFLVQLLVIGLHAHPTHHDNGLTTLIFGSGGRRAADGGIPELRSEIKLWV